MVSAGFSLIFSEVIGHLINRNKPSLTNLVVKMEIWQSNCTFFLGGGGGAAYKILSCSLFQENTRTAYTCLFPYWNKTEIMPKLDIYLIYFSVYVKIHYINKVGTAH